MLSAAVSIELLFDVMARVEAIKVEELGIGQEVQISLAKVDLTRQLLVGRGDGVEVGKVLRHIRGPTAMITSRHDCCRYLRVATIRESER